MISELIVIIITEGYNEVSFMSDGGNAMEEFSILVTKFNPPRFIALPLVNSLGFKKI
jgi:hypothetical protein